MSLFSVSVAAANQTVLDVHGEIVTYTPSGGVAESPTVVIVDPATVDDASPGVVAVIESASSEFDVRPAKGGAVTIESTDYTIFDVKEPRPGWLRVALKK